MAQKLESSEDMYCSAVTDHDEHVKFRDSFGFEKEKVLQLGAITFFVIMLATPYLELILRELAVYKHPAWLMLAIGFGFYTVAGLLIARKWHVKKLLFASILGTAILITHLFVLWAPIDQNGVISWVPNDLAAESGRDDKVFMEHFQNELAQLKAKQKLLRDGKPERTPSGGYLAAYVVPIEKDPFGIHRIRYVSVQTAPEAEVSFRKADSSFDADTSRWRMRIPDAKERMALAFIHALINFAITLFAGAWMNGCGVALDAALKRRHS